MPINTRNIRFFDMFAGIGGFRAGLERAGGFACIGHSEIDKHADKAVVDTDMRIRRLTQKECLRLQGFSDKQIDKLLAVTSDTQAYKQAGNAVTVNVIHALGLRFQAVWLDYASTGAEKEAA